MTKWCHVHLDDVQVCSDDVCFRWQSSEKASIQRLTESFVTKLQAGFPSTVSTIYRSARSTRVVNHTDHRNKLVKETPAYSEEEARRSNASMC